jgi:hypothetical protein
VESYCECGNKPEGSVKCWKTVKWEAGGLSSSAQLHRVS